MFKKVNPNPQNNITEDCVIRALSIAMNKNWYETYINLCIEGLVMAAMPSSNRVWNSYLKKNGWKRYVLSDDCPECYTVKDFCGEYFKGRYILGTGSHVVTVIDGNYYDTWDSGDEIPVFYWKEIKNVSE